MVVLALGIGFALQNQIEARALRQAEQLTRVFNRLAVAPNLTPRDLGGRSRRPSGSSSMRPWPRSRTRTCGSSMRISSPPME